MPLDSHTIIEKRSAEKLIVSMDFGAWLSSGETLSSVDSITAVGQGSDVTIGSGTISGSRVVFSLEGGESGVRYAVTVTVTTSLTQILAGEGPLKVY